MSKIEMHRSPIWCDALDTYVACPESLVSTLNSEPHGEDHDWECPDNVYPLDDDEDDAKRMLALMLMEDDFDMSISVCRYGDGKILECGRREWLVVTDDEADELWDQDLESYIDDCILGELTGMAADYFDREKWKRDARIDGRAHSLNRYDGNEETEDVAGETYYIYRQN